MRLVNKSGLDTDALRAVLQFALSETDHRGVIVTVRPRPLRRDSKAEDCVTGWAFPRRFTLLVPRFPETAAHPPAMWNGYRLTAFAAAYPQSVPIEGWADCIIAVAAHEMRHVIQFRTRRPLSEVDTELYAARVLNKWRVATGRDPVLPAPINERERPAALRPPRRATSEVFTNRARVKFLITNRATLEDYETPGRVWRAYELVQIDDRNQERVLRYEGATKKSVLVPCGLYGREADTRD